MIHIYHGDGKGKTTAAFGLAIRQLGHQGKVLVVQFLKDGDSGEMLFLQNQEHVTLSYAKMPALFYFQLDKEQQAKVKQQQHQLFVDACVTSRDATCIIFDEILDAISLGMIDEEELYAFLTDHPHQEIVLTGRNPSKQLQEMADYITEMRLEKHPYQKHIPSRKGVEY